MSNGDTDPANSCLLYIANRFDITLEQRFWLCFLYSTCYCGPTAYYMFNEFPDYELIDLDRLEKWWKDNKHKLIFTTDRAWIRSRDQFVDIIRSYQKITGKSQIIKYESLKENNKQKTYQNCFKEFSKVYQMGRFTLFIYLDVIHHITGYPIEPDGIDLKYAESSRNGLCYAIGREDLITDKNNKKLNESDYVVLQNEFKKIYERIYRIRPWDTNVWALETSMCAFKKYKKNNKRWVGYYIERQKKDIVKMQNAVNRGVNWNVLWDYRKEYFPHKMLSEKAIYELF
jgi:hypothetical protein